MTNKEQFEKSYKHAVAYGYQGTFTSFAKPKYYIYYAMVCRLGGSPLSYEDWLERRRFS